MDDRYGALINKFNRMLQEDINKLVQLDFSSSIIAGSGASFSATNFMLAYGAINMAAATANQSQEAMAQFHASSSYSPGVGIINDLAWRLNSVGVYVDPHQMGVLASNVSASGCRLAGEFNIFCGRAGRTLALRADNVNPAMLNEVCALVRFNTKGRSINTTGLTVTQAGRLYMDRHRPLRFIEKATKLLAIYVIISDHTVPDYLCTFDI